MPHTDPTRFSNTHPTIASFLNELFDRIEIMHMVDDQIPVYDRLGLKPDDREIHIPMVTHLVATVKCPAGGSSSQRPELKTVYTPVSDHRDLACNPDSGVRSGNRPVSVPDLSHSS